MADMDSICGRLCLLTRAAWRKDLPSPLMRANVHRMVRTGALEGLTLRERPGIKKEFYTRAEVLMSRSAQVYEEVAQSIEQGYDVILPQDDAWPVNLCALAPHMPQFLFIQGNRKLFAKRAVAVAGSRRIENTTADIAKSIGKRIAEEGLVMVCGGAQGVDTAAQCACLEAGGSLILVPAYPCYELLRQQVLQHALDCGKLLIVCDTWPNECFSAQKALSRNHAIYALGDAAIAVAARNGMGGTWRGAADCLRGKYTPLFAVEQQGGDFAGNRELISLGARPLDPQRPLAPQLFGSGV